MPGSVNRFLGHFQPSLALILETELWPNMLFALGRRAGPCLPALRQCRAASTASSAISSPAWR
ncbi:hypothetical protein C7E18_23650 [Stenotrophomonas maltophilia]|nr:hypothetical protein C7E18_23650 [Stenotrophomonas maltophilia]